MNGTLLAGAMRGSAVLDMRLLGMRDVWLMCFSDAVSSDLFRLCGLAVRFGSRGFMSGGSLAICRKVIARYTPRTSERRRSPPSMTHSRKVVYTMYQVVSGTSNSVFQP